MTTKEFDQTGWGANMKARHHRDGRVYLVASCDFEEKLLGLSGMIENEPTEITWVRCENIDLLGQQHQTL